MHRLITGVCLAGAMLLTAASIYMNWSFWIGQGNDASSSQVLGAVSIGIDVFKASLPLVIAWAWSARLRLGCLIGITSSPAALRSRCSVRSGLRRRRAGP